MTERRRSASDVAEEPGVLSRVRTEAICERCGYNLCMQGVRRDGATELLVVRCPECSRVFPAACLTHGAPRRAAGVAQVLLALRGLAALLVLLSLFGLGLALTAALSRHLRPDYESGLALLLGGGLYVGLWLVFWLLAYRMSLPWRLMLAAGLALGAGGTYILDRAYPGSLFYIDALMPAELTAAALLLCATVVLAIACRPLLRAILRALLPTASRYLFEDLWRLDRRLVTLGRW